MSNNHKTIAQIISEQNLIINKNKLPDKGRKGKIVRVNPNTLLINEDFQRKLNNKHALNIGQNFQYINMKIPNGFMNENGQITLTDGQHTCVGAVLAGVKEIQVYVIPVEDLSNDENLKQQSKQFLGINTNQKNVSQYDIFRNELIQKNKTALDIKRVCDNLGVTLCPNIKSEKQKPGSLSHIDNLKKAWVQIGPIPTTKAIEFVRHYWPEDPISSNLFMGLTRFYQHMIVANSTKLPNALVNDEILYKALSNNGMLRFQDIDTLMIIPKFSQTGALSTTRSDIWRAMAIHIIYNEYAKDEEQLGKYVRL